MALAVILVLLTFRDYGVTWDEDVHNWYGNFVLDYYLSLFSDKTALHWLDLYNYGAVFDMTAAALNRVSPIGVYETRHLLNGLVGVLGLIGCASSAGAAAGARAGFIAALFLLLTPNYYGQMFNNPKDIPFAVGVVWATYYMVRIVPALPRPPFGLLAKLGAAIGMTLGVRIGGLLLLCYLGLLLALDGAWRAIAARRAQLLVESAWTSLWRVFAPVAAIAYPVMLLFWPWAQTDPIENPLRALAIFSHETFPFYTLFAGRFIPATDLPWTYLPTYIAIALPELVLVLLLCAPVHGRAGPVAQRFRSRAESGALTAFVLGVGDRLPGRLCHRDQGRAVRRHAAFHFRAAADCRCRRGCRRSRARLAAPGFRSGDRYSLALALYGVAHVSILAMLHPDQYVYYNAFVGGVEGAQRKFKLDYWANSYAEAVRGLEDYLRAEYGADFEEREFTVAVCGPPISARLLLPAEFPVGPRARSSRFLYRLHQGQLRPFAARPAGLSGRAHGRAALGRAGSPRACRAADRQAACRQAAIRPFLQCP